MPIRAFGLFLSFAVAVVPWAGPAAQAPACDAQAEGTVACVAGRLCGCRFGRGSPATGLADGFRWDCGILRPRCGDPIPATIDPYQGPLPDALAIERETT